jgi:hypothetical protein
MTPVTGRYSVSKRCFLPYAARCECDLESQVQAARTLRNSAPESTRRGIGTGRLATRDFAGAAADRRAEQSLRK